MELLLKEINKFIEEMKLKKELSIRNKDNYIVGMQKAFDDAFNQYARRKKITYASNKQTLMQDVVDRLFKYFNSDTDSFEKCFEDCIELSKKIFGNNQYGVAQKFINMSFKYLYCYNDATEFESKFQNCHMPLDKYTIKWIKSLKSTDINRRLNKINNAWSNIDEALYDDIQELVTENLKEGFEYVISFNKTKEQKCVLPKNKLHAEFIIWHQEKVNELFKIIKEAESDFDRLGIVWI